MANWRPLSKRNGDPSVEDDTLYDGVPAHLAQPLLHWLESLFAQFSEHDKFAASERRAGRIAARLRIDLRQVPQNAAYGRIPSEDAFIIEKDVWVAARALVFHARKSGETVLLDVVDATLAEGVSKNAAQELQRLLADSGSAWRVADSRTSLERRVDPTATDAFHQAATGNPATHLAAAWTAAFGRHPNPTAAYSEAIKAVETACIPVVIPGAQGAKATLGKVIIALNDHQQDWQLAIHSSGAPADISPLLAMLRLLWQGQTDRHGGSTPTVPVTVQAAEAAVHLAVTLVQWFQSGAIQRVGAP